MCILCGTDLNGKKFKLDNKKDPRCLTCYEKTQEEKTLEERMCSKCKLLIVGPYIQLHGQYIHPEHYKCTECGCELNGGNCFEFDTSLYCRPHYEALLRKTCAKCQKPIVGTSITALGNVWHPEHFTCHICNDMLVDGQYYEESGKAYCQEHFIQLFGKYCIGCNQVIEKDGVKFVDGDYHIACFKCTKCEQQLRTGHFTEWDGQPMCLDCYGKLPKKSQKKC